MKNGLEVLECTSNLSQNELLFCRDDIADRIEAEGLCGGNITCPCVKAECLGAVNAQISAILDTPLNCSDLELTLCPANTFKRQDIQFCASQINETQICSCILSKCGDFIDVPTFFTVLTYFLLVFLSLVAIVYLLRLICVIQSNKNLLKWLQRDGNLLKQTFGLLFLFYFFLFLAVAVQLRIMFTSKRRDYVEAAEIRFSLEGLASLVVLVMTLVGFFALVQIERTWLHLAWSTAKIFHFEKAMLHLKYTEFIANVVFVTLLVMFVLGTVIANVVEFNGLFKEGGNLLSGVFLLCLGCFTGYVQWRFSVNLREFLTDKTQKLIKHTITVVTRYCLVFQVLLSLSAVGFFLDAFDSLDNANYAEADYAFLIQVVPTAISISLVLFYLNNVITERHRTLTST